MKKAMLKRSLALGALMAFVITGSALAEEVQESGSIYTSTTVENSIIVNGDRTLTFGKTIETVSLAALNAEAKINLYGDQVSVVSVTGSNDGNRAVYAQSNGTITLGNGSSIVSVKATGENAMGIIALTGHVIVNAQTLNVTVEGEGAFGIHVQNNKQLVEAPADAASVTINANTINVTSDDLGISAFSNGQMNISGDLTVNASHAIDVRGNSTVNINTDGKHKTVLNGDIVFETPNTPEDAKNSGNLINAYVNVGLYGEESSWTGKAYQSYGDGDSVELESEPYYGNVTGFKMTIADGATWNMTGDSFVNNLTLEDGGVVNIQSNVEEFNANTLSLDDGIINLQGGASQIATISDLDGDGGTVNFAVNGADGGLATAALDVEDSDSNTKVTANYVGIDADDVATKENFADLVAKSLKVGGDATFTAVVEEGLLTPAMTGVTTNNTNGNTIEIKDIQQSGSTTTMDSMRDIASTAIIAWRQEDSTLSQRLGELRNSEGDQGVWVRMSRGEFEYSGAYKNQYNYFQMGYDKAYGAWHYGAAISHNDGETTYANGKGDNRSTSLSLYGTWLGEHGQYADIVLKQGRLSNEFEIHTAAGDTRGDYDAWGTSLSGEYGVKVDMADGWYVTPQAQMTFMRIGGEDYTTSNDIRVSQDTLYSTVGRVGFELGKQLTDKGSVYAKASLLHEFAGDADTYLRLGDLHNSYSQDIGNTWYEAGLGFNYKTSANSCVYADVVKTFGDDIKTPWQWNAGMRWSF